MAEAIAVREGIKLAWDLGIRALILEGDAKEVMESVQASDENRYQTGLILSTAYGLTSKFHYFKAQFVPRACNQVADKLVRLARDGHDQIWYNEVLDCIKDVISLNIGC